MNDIFEQCHSCDIYEIDLSGNILETSWLVMVEYSL